ncbi:hypothetical protein CsatB_020731 [Cannabis sativa]
MSNMLSNLWMQRPSSYPSRAFISLWDLFGLKLLFLRRLDPKCWFKTTGLINDYSFSV